MNNESRKTRILYFLLLIYVAALSAYNLTVRLVAYADCPTCFKDETPVAATSDPQGGRPYYAIYTDSSVTDAKFTSALTGAMSDWNAAPGTNGQGAPITFRNFDPAPPGGGAPPAPQVLLRIGSLGTTKKGEEECGVTTTERYKSAPQQIINYIITLPPEAVNWTQARIKEVIDHELGHVLGVDDVNQGCTSIMQQGSANCTASVHTTIENRDVDAAQRYATNRTTCQKTRKTTNEVSTGGGDACNGDPCCGDPCCGDPSCGGYDCYIVCDSWCECVEEYEGECYQYGYCDTDCYEYCY